MNTVLRFVFLHPRAGCDSIFGRSPISGHSNLVAGQCLGGSRSVSWSYYAYRHRVLRNTDYLQGW
jgi:hypothetical protein